MINGEAVLLPKPPYPEMARQLKIQGVVSVQVLVDETGRVVSAKAVSGNPFLVRDAQRLRFRRASILLYWATNRLKVSGVITSTLLQP